MTGISMLRYPFILQMRHLRSCRWWYWQCISVRDVFSEIRHGQGVANCAYVYYTIIISDFSLCVRACVCMCLFVRSLLCLCMSFFVCGDVCVCECVRACVRACVLACVRASVCTGATDWRAYVRLRLRLCVRAYVRVYAWV